MDRADLLKENAAIFKTQGEALNKVSNKESVRVTVVGNPANTNAWIAAQYAPDIDPRQFSAMTRLDHNRALAQLADKTGEQREKEKVMCVAHSSHAQEFMLGRLIDSVSGATTATPWCLTCLTLSSTANGPRMCWTRNGWTPLSPPLSRTEVLR